MGTANSKKKVSPATEVAVGFVAGVKVDTRRTAAASAAGPAKAADGAPNMASLPGATSSGADSGGGLDNLFGGALASGEVDGMMEHRGGLKGLKLKVEHESSSDEDGEEELEGGDTGWLDKEELVDLEDLKKQYNSNVLLDPEINDMLERKDAVRGLKVKSDLLSSSESDSDDDDDAVMDDWLDNEDPIDEEDEGVDEDEEIEVGVAAQLFEESTWTHMDALTAVFDRAKLDKEQQAKIISMLQEAQFEPNSYIVRQGEMGDKFFIIKEGEVVVTRSANPGEPSYVVTHLYQGHFFGETSLATEAPRNASIMAVRDRVTCLYMTKEQFTPLLQKDERFRDMINELVRRVNETARKRAELAKKRVGDAPEENREDVKISKLHRYGKTKDKQLVINDYVVIKKLGAGAFGVVYLTLNLSNGKAYAMKIVDRAQFRRKTMKSDDEMLKEVAVMKKLQHRNVVLLYEVIDDPGHDKFYIVQELMKGGELMDDTEVNEAMDVEKARQVFRHMLLGLDYLHFQGVIHRDIKPGNVLLTDTGVAKLGDFGASATTDPKTGILKGTDVQGTPAYMAPELFKDGLVEYNGFAVDLWAAGCTLYHLIVGVPPFMANNEMELVEKLTKERPRVSPVIETNPHLKNLLQRILDKNPETRITLPECLIHDWVTLEGSEPLKLSVHTRLRLNATHVDFETGTPIASAAKNAAQTASAAGGGAGGKEESKEQKSSALKPRSASHDDASGAMHLGDDVIAVDESDMLSDGSGTLSPRRNSGAGRHHRGNGSMRVSYSMSIQRSSSDGGAVKHVTPANYNESIKQARRLKDVKSSMTGDASSREKDMLVERVKTENVLSGVDPKHAVFSVAEAPESSTPVADGASDGIRSMGSDRDILSTQQALTRVGSLRRQADFVMVTEKVDSDTKKALIIRNKSGKSFSSVTGASSSVTSGQSAGTTDINPDAIAEVTESATSDEDDSDLSSVETLDDMVGGGAITEGLDNLFDDLIDGDNVDDDDDIAAIESDDEGTWEAKRFELSVGASGSCNKELGLVIGSDETQGDRASMEDRTAIIADCGEFFKDTKTPMPVPHCATAMVGVYDGHNGDKAATYLQENLHHRMAEASAFTADDVPAAVEKSFLAADAELYERAGEDISDPSGSTANVLVVRASPMPTHAPTIVCANVGDARCVLSRGGNALDLSVDHRPSRGDEKERVEKCGGWIVKGRLHGVLAVTRSFGDAEHKGKHKERLWEQTFTGEPLTAMPEIAQETVLPEDEFAVIGCDGVWDVMTSQQAVNFVRRQLLKNPDISVAAQCLVKKAIEMRTVDNVSVAIIAFHQYGK